MAMDIEAVTQSIRKKSTLAKWGIGLGTAILLGPLIWMAAYAVLGAAALLASLAIAGTVGLVIINSAPVVTMKLANAKINAIIAEATKNPIPTLWELHRKDQQELDGMAKAIEDYSTEIGNCESKAKQLAKDLTPENLEDFNRDIKLLKTDLYLMEGEYDDAVKAHQQQEVQIKQASAIWELNMAVHAANAKNVNRAEETLAKIKRDTALDSVTSSMNRSKAQLQRRIRNRASAASAGTGQLQLANEPSNVLPLVTDITAKEPIQQKAA